MFKSGDTREIVKNVRNIKHDWLIAKPHECGFGFRLEVFLRKGALKIYSKCTGEHACRSVISIKLLYFATLLKSHFGIGVLL